jgi:alpha-tubulin suppressor-like RCC1 family protein
VSGLSNVTAIAAGDGDFVCALLSNDIVSCWGDNSNGQLGDGTTTPRPAPVTVSGLTGATAIAAGQEHSCALVSGGAVQCWGSNTSGQLGNGSTINSFVPVGVTGISGATTIGAGNSHSCALLSGGGVMCWGQNTYGQLGDDTMVSSPIAQGSSPGVNPIGVAAGWGHSCELFPDGTVQCWGDNGYGELGQGIYGGTFASPVPVSGLNSATGISGSYAATCALLPDQTVKCWGYGYGQSPVAISGVSGAVSISASGSSWSHACAVLATGKVSCWGDNSWGQLGNGSSTPPGANQGSTTAVPVSNISNAIAVAAHAHGTCALLSNGTVQCWGANVAGELGTGTTTGPNTCFPPYNWPCSTIPAPAVSGLGNVVAIAAGDGDFVCALLSNGTVSCWGDNSNGQLGDGTTTPRPAPVAVSGLTGATAVAAGQEHSCALVSGGTVQCWGSNTSGQLGNGKMSNSLVPVGVAALSGAMTISAGNSHSCALLSGGGSRCWGDNTYGQLGNRAAGSSPIPVTTCIPGGCADPSGLACQSTTIARAPVNPSQPFDLASDGTSLYWTDTAAGTVGRVALNGTAPATVVSGIPGIGGIAVDATALYFTDIAQGTVSSVPTSGGTPQTLAAGQRVPRFIVSDRDRLVWTNQGTARTDGSVRQLTKSTGQLAALADGQPAPWAVISIGGVAYWSDTLAGGVFAAASPGAPIQTIATALTSPSVVTGGAEPYLSSTDGRLFDFVAASQQLSPRAVAAAGAFSLAANGSSLFWTNGLADTVGQQLTAAEFPSTIWRRPGTGTPRVIKLLAGALWFSVAAPTNPGSIFTFAPDPTVAVPAGAPACAPAGPGAIPSLACQSAAAPIVPFLECVAQMPDNSLVAHFGYTNQDSVARRVGVGAANQFDRSDGNGCQPTTFAPGTHHDVFAVGFVDEISWKVGVRSATALSVSPHCSPGAVRNTEVSP